MQREARAIKNMESGELDLKGEDSAYLLMQEKVYHPPEEFSSLMHCGASQHARG